MPDRDTSSTKQDKTSSHHKYGFLLWDVYAFSILCQAGLRRIQYAFFFPGARRFCFPRVQELCFLPMCDIYGLFPFQCCVSSMKIICNQGTVILCEKLLIFPVNWKDVIFLRLLFLAFYPVDLHRASSRPDISWYQSKGQSVGMTQGSHRVGRSKCKRISKQLQRRHRLKRGRTCQYGTTLHLHMVFTFRISQITHSPPRLLFGKVLWLLQLPCTLCRWSPP